MFFSIVLGMQTEQVTVLWSYLELRSIGFLSISIAGGQRGDFIFKYFLVQGMGSSMLLSRVFLESAALASLVLVTSIILKLGAAPFHHWFVDLSSKRS